jgi:hypothetical protein
MAPGATIKSKLAREKRMRPKRIDMARIMNDAQIARAQTSLAARHA